MTSWLTYLATRREAAIRAYKAAPPGTDERAWFRRRALRRAELLREWRG